MSQTQLKFDIDLSGALKKFGLVEQEIRRIEAELLQELTEHGAEVARLTLDRATTRYGMKRYSRGRGNSPGRNDTGRMIDRLRALKVSEGENGGVTGGVGWYYADEYFKYQERGTGRNATAGPRANASGSAVDYSPDFNYSSAVIDGRGGGIVGAHSLWAARKAMEDKLPNAKRKFVNRVRRASNK